MEFLDVGNLPCTKWIVNCTKRNAHNFWIFYNHDIHNLEKKLKEKKEF